MSLVDPAFESNVITLLKGIYDNVGGGLPYTSVCGAFTQISDTEIIYREYSNNSGYQVNVAAADWGHVNISLPDYTGLQQYVGFFIGSALDQNSVISTDFFVSNLIGVYSKGIASGSNDPRGFGYLSGTFINFELRFYPEP